MVQQLLNSCIVSVMIKLIDLQYGGHLIVDDVNVYNLLIK